jgi:hypothetical protein
MPRLPDTRPQVHATTDTPVHYGRPACIAQVHSVSGGRSIRRPPRLVTIVSALPQGRLRAAAMSAGGHRGVCDRSVRRHADGGPLPQSSGRLHRDTAAACGGHHGPTGRPPRACRGHYGRPRTCCGSSDRALWKQRGPLGCAGERSGPLCGCSVGGVPDSTEQSDLSQNSLPPALAVTYDLVAVHQLIHEDESYRAPASDAWHPGPEAGCRR